jgi:hypothetical protein
MVLGLLMALVTASSPAPAPQTDRLICEVGRQAMLDLPRFDASPPKNERFYGEKYVSGILSKCPSLRMELPRPYRLAEASEYQRRAEIISAHPVSIFFTGVPVMDADGTRAIFDVGFSCNGLCGVSYRAVYIRTEHGWQMEGSPQVKSVS